MINAKYFKLLILSFVFCSCERKLTAEQIEQIERYEQQRIENCKPPDKNIVGKKISIAGNRILFENGDMYYITYEGQYKEGPACWNKVREE